MENLPWHADQLKPQWSHPFLFENQSANQKLDLKRLESFAYGYFLKFLPYFRDQPEGSLGGSVEIEFCGRLKRKLGVADLGNRLISLNKLYFAKTPHLLPYTLFHELTHIWLYDCDIDPGHTKRFYRKMKEFEQTGLPFDGKVHIHKRTAPEGQFVFQCPECLFKWFVRKKIRAGTECAGCHVALVLKACR